MKQEKKKENLFPKSLAYFEVQLLHAGHQGCSKPWVSILFLDITQILRSLFPVGHSKEMLPGLKFGCPFYVGLKNGFLPVWVFFKFSCEAECLRPLKSNGSVDDAVAICNLRAVRRILVHTRERGRLGMGRMVANVQYCCVHLGSFGRIICLSVSPF